ncbi:hypothetical protein Cob_v008011 [Colletotrichum orbiculare MAFF 240422]|uniref:Uncharacterized protein n=1 Tax=Colletotrichum orbiculare (strain 104-T / ATCC 96160 / CBS 514.97 / LARS 414 / MAFF 240422) TaxID=1213857 RepID=A0A484FN57_COLOR|nr:hypothetical protein Cob_v008011 [Colletotrichum orbiculare MAFF 240422]
MKKSVAVGIGCVVPGLVYATYLTPSVQVRTHHSRYNHARHDSTRRDDTTSHATPRHEARDMPQEDNTTHGRH